MACLSENMLVAFFAGSARSRTPALVAEVEAHTATCQACRNLLVQYAGISAANGTSQTRADEPAKFDSVGRQAHRTSAFPPDAAESVGRQAHRASAFPHDASESVAAPSLTPRADAGGEGAELSHRLARAHAEKLIGVTLKGKWTIEAPLGFGGMASVFAARHRNGRRVAIKCMRPELALERSLVERFLREGYVANKIEHPGAVAILDDDIMDDGTPFLVMELLTGKTLRQELARGPLALRDALAVTADILDVLAAAHDKDIVHRDLKPDNLFRTESGSIKVLDFGIARLRERTRSGLETQSGTTMGTVGFMPPEQARGTASIDARSDVWAIGATLFTLLTGRSVHEAPTVNEALLLAMTAPVSPMARLLAWVPRPIQAIMDRALAFDQNDRYANARAMKLALEAAQAGLGSTVVLSPSLARDSAPPGDFASSHASASVIARVFSKRRGSSESSASSKRRGAIAIAATAGAFVLLLTVGVLLVNSGESTKSASPGIVATPAPSDTLVGSSRIADTQPIETPADTAFPSTDASPPTSKPTTKVTKAASPSLSTGRSPNASAMPAPSSSPPRAAPRPVDTRDPLGVRH